MKYILLSLLIGSLLYFGYHNRPYDQGYSDGERDTLENIMTHKEIRYFDEAGRIYEVSCPKDFKKVEDCEWITSN